MKLIYSKYEIQLTPKQVKLLTNTRIHNSEAWQRYEKIFTGNGASTGSTKGDTVQFTAKTETKAANINDAVLKFIRRLSEAD